jgi:cation transport ATPase
VLVESALTGESVPVERLAGDRIASGVVNAGSPFDLRAVAPAAESTYAAIVRLVAEAEASRAPFVRLADRYSVWFLPLTVAVAALRAALLVVF